MKTKIEKIENIQETEFTMEVNIVSLDSEPNTKEQNELFDINDSIVLEF